MGRRANGDGTIFKRKDGRWSAQAYVTLTNGERKRICITLRTCEAVRVKLHEVLEQEYRRIPYVEKDWTVAEYFDYWIKKVKPGYIRETTIEIYDRIIMIWRKRRDCRA
jgi:hypothetical protein